jgi:hypothetical protein
MRIWKIGLALAATACMTTPAWALPAQTPSNRGTEHAPSITPVGPPSTTPNNTDNPGSGNRSSAGSEHSGGGQHGSAGRQHTSTSDGSGAGGSNSNGSANGSGSGGNGGNHAGHGRPSHPGNSHKCTPHNVAYVAAGTLVSQTLSKDTGGTPAAGRASSTPHPNHDGTYSGEVTVEVKRTNHHAAGDRGTTKTYKVEHVRVTFALADINNDGSIGLDDLQAGDRVKLIGKITALAPKCDHTGFTATTTIRHIVLHAPTG